MEWMEKIRTAFERNAKALSLRPSHGQGTAVTTVRMRDGLTLDVEEGPWKFTVDMGAKSGGNDAGPNPGVLARGALGTCLAVSYILWAARRALPLRSLEVEVQADYDARGYHGVDNVRPGYKEIRYVVRVESEAPEAEVMRVLDEADAHCDNLFLFADEQKITRQVQLNTPER
jgi:uncharacterized OsmC-like protein